MFLGCESAGSRGADTSSVVGLFKQPHSTPERWPGKGGSPLPSTMAMHEPWETTGNEPSVVEEPKETTSHAAIWRARARTRLSLECGHVLRHGPAPILLGDQPAGNPPQIARNPIEPLLGEAGPPHLEEKGA